MKLIPDLVDDAHNFTRWWSVRCSAISTACSGALMTYGTIAAINGTIVQAFPQKLLSALAIGAVISSGMSVLLRPLKQNIPPPMPKPTVPPSNDFHQGPES